MRLSVRAVPWLLALAGLAIPLVGSGFVVWLFTVAWLVALAVAWTVARAARPLPRDGQIVIAVALLPVLFVLAWEGGWWLIPADLAWLLIELADRRGPRPPAQGRVAGR